MRLKGRDFEASFWPQLSIYKWIFLHLDSICKTGNYLFEALAIWASDIQIELTFICFQLSNTTLTHPLTLKCTRFLKPSECKKVPVCLHLDYKLFCQNNHLLTNLPTVLFSWKWKFHSPNGQVIYDFHLPEGLDTHIGKWTNTNFKPWYGECMKGHHLKQCSERMRYLSLCLVEKDWSISGLGTTWGDTGGRRMEGYSGQDNLQQYGQQ